MWSGGPAERTVPLHFLLLFPQFAILKPFQEGRPDDTSAFASENIIIF